MTYWITVYPWESVSLIDWISDTFPQEYTDLQSLLKCLDHICMIQSIKGNLDIACFVRHDLHGKVFEESLACNTSFAYTTAMPDAQA